MPPSPKNGKKATTSRAKAPSKSGRSRTGSTSKKPSRSSSKAGRGKARFLMFQPLFFVWALAVAALAGLLIWGSGSGRLGLEEIAQTPRAEQTSADESRTATTTRASESPQSRVVKGGVIRQQPSTPPEPTQSSSGNESQPVRASHSSQPSAPTAEALPRPVMPSPPTAPVQPSGGDESQPVRASLPPQPSTRTVEATPAQVPEQPEPAQPSTGNGTQASHSPIGPPEPDRSVNSTAMTAMNRPAPRPDTIRREPMPPAEPPLARLAIVIDDFGQDKEIAKKFLDLPFSVTFSVLPHQAHSKEIAQLAHGRRRQVMLHLPMEPQGYPKTKPGAGSLLLTMSSARIEETIRTSLESHPHVAGVNNHMGSRFTEDEGSMRIVMKELTRRKLFFLDSFTSPKSVGYSLAREFKIPAGRRDIFLDHDLSENAIRAQLQKAIRKARVEGSAIAIGHPHEVTLKVLAADAERFKEEKVAVVPAGELMEAN